jgi:hypothetical protein
MGKTITFTITISDDNKVTVSGINERIVAAEKTKRKYKKRKGMKRVKKSDVTYTDMWGKEWPIYVTHSGKEFIVRKKHRGSNKYKHYIK